MPELIVRCKPMRRLVLMIILACLTGCSPAQRTISGPYRLERFDENGKFYIEKAGGEKPGGGCIEGTVEEIGLTNGLIFAKRHSTYRGDPDGWMIIDVSKQSITGPLSDADFKERYPGVQTLAPENLWRRLYEHRTGKRNVENAGGQGRSSS